MEFKEPGCRCRAVVLSLLGLLAPLDRLEAALGKMPALSLQSFFVIPTEKKNNRAAFLLLRTKKELWISPQNLWVDLVNGVCTPHSANTGTPQHPAKDLKIPQDAMAPWLGITDIGEENTWGEEGSRYYSCCVPIGLENICNTMCVCGMCKVCVCKMFVWCVCIIHAVCMCEVCVMCGVCVMHLCSVCTVCV